MLLQKSPLILWGRKGKRLLGAAKEFVDIEVVESDRMESSSSSGSDDTDDGSSESRDESE